ncbi:MAG: DUF2283 domain-containing protein [Dehalococcoidia bacterium]|nr:DUF2283 domain-containing protein [Dehalococcoidia bacterium]
MMIKFNKGYPREGGCLGKARISYDEKKDILYIVLREGTEERFEDISENITVEYNDQGRPMGIEIFEASKVLPIRARDSHVIT